MHTCVHRSLCLMAVVLAILLMPFQQAWSKENLRHRVATEASNSLMGCLAVDELSLLTDGKDAKKEMLRGAEAMVATELFTQVLKHTVREKRPHGETHDSFPSGHASAAFAMATVVSEYKPKYRWVAYGTAAVIGWSRVETGKHRWRDVLAGAALGYFTAKGFVGKHIEVTPDGVSCVWTW